MKCHFELALLVTTFEWSLKVKSGGGGVGGMPTSFSLANFGHQFHKSYIILYDSFITIEHLPVHPKKKTASRKSKKPSFIPGRSAHFDDNI